MRQAVLTKAQLSTFAFNRGAAMFFGQKPQTPAPKDLEKALVDLRKVQDEALIVGGIAVIHYGYERATKDIDILYANGDTGILERLAPFFEVTLKAVSGWHHLQHKKTGVQLELIPEGGLTQYGFIPSPRTVGSGKEGVISLLGLVWLKLVSGRLQDLGDLSRLAKIRFEEMKLLEKILPPELRDRFSELLNQARKEINNDPHAKPSQVQEAPAAYTKRKAKKRKSFSA